MQDKEEGNCHFHDVLYKIHSRLCEFRPVTYNNQRVKDYVE